MSFDLLRHIADVEAQTVSYVHWCNNDWLHSVLDYLSPQEYERVFSALPTASPSGDADKKTA